MKSYQEIAKEAVELLNRLCIAYEDDAPQKYTSSSLIAEIDDWFKDNVDLDVNLQ